MILASGMLILAVATARVGSHVLLWWGRSDRAPLAVLVAWQLLTWSVVINVALAAAVISLPSLAAAGRLPGALESCLQAVHGVANPADSPLLRAGSLVLLGAVVGRLLWCALTSAWVNHRQRSRHRDLLSLLTRLDPCLGAHVLTDATAMAYCLPGRGGRVVLTSAAVEQLTAPQCAAVLAHERAHLHGRHHLILASSRLLVTAFPRVKLFATGFEHTARLVEMRADDLASLGCGRRPVADALLALAEMGSSTTLLAASAVTTAARIERLLTDEPSAVGTPSEQLRRVAVLVFGGCVLLSSPVLVAAAGHAALCLI